MDRKPAVDGGSDPYAPDIRSLVELADCTVLPGRTKASFGDIGERFDELFEDVREIERLEALSLRGVLGEAGVRSVLDCACGTGIQAFGLAASGYKVAASDLSTKLVRLVAAEARRRGLSMEVRRSDFRSLRAWEDRQFDAVVCCGNSLPLLASTTEIKRALRAIKRVLRAGGVAVVSNRDYTAARAAGETILPRRLIEHDGRPEWVFDLRLFGSERTRVVNCFLGPHDGHWRLRTFVKSYLHLPAVAMAMLLEEAGFIEVKLLDMMALHPYDGGEWYIATFRKRTDEQANDDRH